MIAALFLLLLLLGGCQAASIDQYFSLPQPAEEYLQLQSLLDEEIASGWEYAAPTGGNYRQAIQLIDLDHDNSKEAVAFLRDASHNMKINIYRVMRGSYVPALTIPGDGSSVGSVEFADLSGDDFCEMTVSWQIGTELRMLTVYRLEGWVGDPLFTTSCTEYLLSDLTGDSRQDIVTISCSGLGERATGLISFHRDYETETYSAPLSYGVSELKRIRTVSLQSGENAVLVESICEDGSLVSDLFARRGDKFFNITLDKSINLSVTARNYAVFATDIDNDGVLEIPEPIALYSPLGAGSYWIISWVGYMLSGESVEKMKTYHSFADGWFFELPEKWCADLTVRRQDEQFGERSVVLATIDSSTGKITDKLIIYTLTGENRAERATQGRRFVLGEAESSVFSAEILGDISEKSVRESFHIIYTEWSSGSV